MRTINQRYRLYLFLAAMLLGAVAAGYVFVLQIWKSPLGDLVRLVNSGKPIRAEKLESAVERASAYFEGVPPDVDAQLNYLRGDLGKLADKAQTQFQGGRLYTYAFYGYTLINTCMLESADQKRREGAIRELRSLIDTVESKEVREGYGHNAHLAPRYGVIYQGELNLLEAGYLLLTDDEEIERDFHERSKQLFREFRRRSCRMLESYPGHVFPVDNVAAYWSLYLHDQLYDTRYEVAVDEWLTHLKTIADPHTGCIPSKVRLRDGGAEWEPRGCSESWLIAMLAAFRPETARAEYQRYKQHFGTRLLGVFAFREWRKGVDKPADVDSGPIVQGAGLVATGFGIAATHIMSDRRAFAELLALSEVVGQLPKEGKAVHYLNGEFVLADVLSVWGQTQTVWRALPHNAKKQETVSRSG